MMVTCLTVNPVSAQCVCEPVSCVTQGAAIDSAILTLYAGISHGHEVFVHRVTAPWVEMEVTWNSFNGSYDPAVEGSFTPDAHSFVSVDITPLVQA